MDYFLMAVLDPELRKDTYQLGNLNGSRLLLMRNALFPWFVLVPDTNEVEFHNLSWKMQKKVLKQVNLVSHFIEENNKIDKINIGAIGNVVSQMHVHIIGRSRGDASWPDVVWGIKNFKQYEPDQVEEIKNKIRYYFKDNIKFND